MKNCILIAIIANIKLMIKIFLPLWDMFSNIDICNLEYFISRYIKNDTTCIPSATNILYIGTVVSIKLLKSTTDDKVLVIIGSQRPIIKVGRNVAIIDLSIPVLKKNIIIIGQIITLVYDLYGLGINIPVK